MLSVKFKCSSANLAELRGVGAKGEPLSPNILTHPNLWHNQSLADSLRKKPEQQINILTLKYTSH